MAKSYWQEKHREEAQKDAGSTSGASSGYHQGKQVLESASWSRKD